MAMTPKQKACFKEFVAKAELVIKEAKAKMAAGVIQDHIFHTRITDLDTALKRAQKLCK